MIRSAGSGSPITPVEASSTSCSPHSSVRAVACTSARTVSCPRLPVKALALPALTRIARPRPPVAASASRHQSTGALAVSERVNTPATLECGASSISATSSRPVV